MLIEWESILEVCFQLTLFYLLYVFVSSIVKWYVVPALYSEIEKIKKNKQDIKDKEELLGASKDRLEGEIEGQKEEFFVLSKRVTGWKNAILAEEEKQKEEQEALLVQVKEKRRKQEANLNLLKLQENVIPRSIDLAYKEIEDSYSGQKSVKLLKELISVVQPGNNNFS